MPFLERCFVFPQVHVRSSTRTKDLKHPFRFWDMMRRTAGDFHRAVARAYEALAESEPGVITINSDGPLEEVQERLWTALSANWPDRFPPGA